MPPPELTTVTDGGQRAEPAIGAAGPDDAGEILTLQRAAFIAEALPYGTLQHPALLQSLEDLRAELVTVTALAAVLDGRLVGSVRTLVEGDAVHVRRLAVVPDLQGRGIARALLAHVEATAPASVHRFVLNTGHLNAPALRLYGHLGYVETRREVVDDVLTLVHLELRRP